MPERLDEILGDGKPGRVFVGSMTDLGHQSVNPEWIRSVATAMRAAHHRTYVVLTKRPGPWLRLLPAACWVGVTVELQQEMLRWNQLLGWAWPGSPVKFVSVEPMLGPVRFNWPGVTLPDWVIAGPETGPKARPCASWWIDGIAAQCVAAGVPFFDKRKAWTNRQYPVTPTADHIVDRTDMVERRRKRTGGDA